MLPSSAKSIQTLAVIYKAFWVDDATIRWRKVRPSCKLLFFTLVTIQHLLTLWTPLLHALVVCPKGTALVALEPEIISEGLTVCREVS
jgi:hypothetical protein